MTDAAPHRDTVGVMAGSGVYREASTTQHGAAASGLALVPAAIDAAAVAATGPPVVFADFGAAQGNNSLELVRHALAALRARVPERPVFVVHADIVGNDFTTLASVLETSPVRYDAGDHHVLPLMAARSLYDRMLPPGILMFGWTASTLHWLRHPPGPVSDHFFVQCSNDAAARERFAAQSAQDWLDFLEARAIELAPGASVVVVDVLMGHDELMGSEALFDRLNDALIDACRRGQLRPAEPGRVVYPTWFRSLADLRAPFTPEFTAAGGERLELVDLHSVVEEDPFRDQLSDPDAYAASQVAFLRGFLEPSFSSALDPDRTPEQRTEVLDTVWAGARERIAADPTAVSPAYRLVALRVRRVR